VHDGERTHDRADKTVYRDEHTVLLTARLPADIADALFHEATVHGTSPSDLILQALRAMLHDPGEQR